MPAAMTSFRFRLEPTRAQKRELMRTAGAAHWLYNEMLRYREDVWLAARSAGATGIKANLGYLHLCSVLTELKKSRPWLAAVSLVALRGALKNLDRAFASFFAGTGAYPRFKRREDGKSINYNDPGTFEIVGNAVHLPRIGRVAFRMHRPMTGTPRTVSVTFDSGHWYVSIACQGEYTLPNSGGAAVGLDAGIAQSATLSTGETVHFPVATPKEARRIKFFQRQAARRKKGSKRRSRSLRRVARLRRQIADRRTDAAHKLSYRLATTYAVIAVEDLKLRNMTRSAKGTVESPGSNVKAKSGLNRSLLAQGHADLVRMLTYKCERSGAKLVKVAPHFTSQTCSRCGHCAPENRENQADFRCGVCGYQQNADINAALNILAAGQAVIARGGSEVTPAGEPRSDRRTRRSSISFPTPTITSSFS